MLSDQGFAAVMLTRYACLCVNTLGRREANSITSIQYDLLHGNL